MLFVMENFSSPKRRAFWGSHFLSKIRLSISLILLMRVNLWLEKWVQWRKNRAVDSTKFPQLHKGFIAFRKLCRNSSSLRWLKPTRNLVKSFFTFALCTLNMYGALNLTFLTADFEHIRIISSVLLLLTSKMLNPI